MLADEKRIRELCELTSSEPNSERLLQLVAELDQLLKAKEQYILAQRKPSAVTTQD